MFPANASSVHIETDPDSPVLRRPSLRGRLLAGLGGRFRPARVPA